MNELESTPVDWRPGPRPAWVQSLHAISDPRWITLDADALLDEARRRSGLDDFGDDDFLEPYRCFVEALDREAQLYTVGRLIVRDDLLNWLENRLGLAEGRSREPAIAREPVERPLFITGLPRTGTSILHELLACDPAHRAPLHWEVRHPCPPPTPEGDDERRTRAERQVQLWNHVVPEYRVMHELGAELPVECIQTTASRGVPGCTRGGDAPRSPRDPALGGEHPVLHGLRALRCGRPEGDARLVHRGDLPGTPRRHDGDAQQRAR
jgi:hypothetical protein